MTYADVVAGFPGVGKTHLVGQLHEFLSHTRSARLYTIVDLDPSGYTTVDGYLDQLQTDVALGHCVFMSTHRRYHDFLLQSGLQVVLVYPERECLDAWLDRLIDRGSNLAMLNYISANWDRLLTELESLQAPNVEHVRLSSTQYMSDVVEYSCRRLRVHQLAEHVD